MQVRSSFVAATLAAVALVATSAPASTLTYILDNTTPGTSTLYADVSSGDNFGLIAWGVGVTGNFTATNNLSPLVINGTNFAPAGFGAFRAPAAGSDPTGAAVNPFLSGSQDAISGPPANHIRGIGQESSSFVLKGIVPAFQPDATADQAWGALAVGSYDNPVRLATYSWDPLGPAPTFDLGNVNNSGSLWAQATGTSAAAPTSILYDVLGGQVEQFLVDDLVQCCGQLPGALVTGGPLPTNASSGPIAWSLLSLLGPDGAEVGATVDPLSGVFSWQSAATDSKGTYVATIQGVNAGEPAGTDSGTYTFNLVPEPTSFALLSLALVGFGFIRRR